MDIHTKCIRNLLIMMTSLYAGGVTADAMPDLVVRADMLGGQWVVKSEAFDSSTCIESNDETSEFYLEDGDYNVLRFTVGVANIGDADLVIGGNFNQYLSNDNCHGHYHFKNYVKYELIDKVSGYVWRAAKRGFCMIDTDPNPAWLGQPPGPKRFQYCSLFGQGISTGWTDTYRFDLPGQFFFIGETPDQLAIPPGEYTLRITANPPYSGIPGTVDCLNVDTDGFCHTLPESDYTNNIAEVTITVPDHLGRGKQHGPVALPDVAAPSQ